MTPPPPPATAAMADDFIPNFDTAAARDELVNTGTPDRAAGGIVRVLTKAQSTVATKADLQAESNKIKLWVTLHTLGVFVAIFATFFAEKLFN